MISHFIVNKTTGEVEHGPFPTKHASEVAAKHYSWFDDEKHEHAVGEPKHSDVETWSIYFTGVDEPISAPFETKEEAQKLLKLPRFSAEGFKVKKDKN